MKDRVILTESQLDRLTAYKIDPLLRKMVTVKTIEHNPRGDDERFVTNLMRDRARKAGKWFLCIALALPVFYYVIAFNNPAFGSAPAHIVPKVSMGDNDSLEVMAVQQRLRDYGYSVVVDGDYGPQTYAAVTHYQRANGLLPDGIVGPITQAALGLELDAPLQGPVTGAGASGASFPADWATGSETARQALILAGATQWEADFGANICVRESRCTLDAVNTNAGTRDYSWGPWQINYYGDLSSRSTWIGSPESNTWSWERAAQNFLTLLRGSGSCHWSPPNYCAG